MVIGDLMVDEYIHGRAVRISPEAPVMVVKHQRTTRLPGGAANVARNLQALGATTAMVGVAGDDRGAELLATALGEQGLNDVLLVAESGRATTRKVRVLADTRHQALRIDFEDELPISAKTEKALVEGVLDRLGSFDVVVLSDYLKGVLTPTLCSEIIRECKLKNLSVVANPKPSSLMQYKGIDLVSLNRIEAIQAFGGGLSLEDFERGAVVQSESLGGSNVLVTLGDEGMLAVGKQTFTVPAPKVEVYDTAGAGDTVIATVALGLRAIGFRREVFELAAQTAASVVRHVGVATPTAEDLLNLQA